MTRHISSKSFSSKLLNWHVANDRELPWKKDKDPYKIWVSEIILQQTRVKQGTPYYLRFIEAFPNITELANATEDKLLHIWQGLGYYARARNMHFTAKYITEELDGVFPNNYASLIKLKGIGPYTAAAISSFAFDEVKAVLDGNVIRVLSRIFGIESPFDTNQGKTEFQTLADQLIDPKQPADYNQAIMDFGALQCIPGLPDCSNCPFNQHCKAHQLEKVGILPVRQKKISKKHRRFHFFIISTSDGKIIIEKRVEKDIWKSLYQFPMIEQPEDSPFELNLSFPKIMEKYNYIANYNLEVMGEQKQVLTHQIVNAEFYLVQLSTEQIALPPDNYLVDYKNLCNFAYPKLIDWFIMEKIIPLFALNHIKNDQ
jgi:A/G-specific adenine glycosylase